ncbi:MAG: nucleotidyltransferase family protein [Saprospiraceae bacterium]|nr:nucleotidyltransferase family protein [Saprospiraceae bacterium]
MTYDKIKNQIIITLLQYRPERIGIFGSYARGENHKGSDLDILISFKDKISLLRLVQIEQELSDELGIKVDLITENSLKNPRLKNFIYQDTINIFNEKERPDLS